MSLPSPLQGTDNILNAVSAAIGNTIYLPVPCPGRVKLFQACAGASTAPRQHPVARRQMGKEVAPGS